MKRLLLGLGNDILSDDAIGPKLVKRIEHELSFPNTEYLTAAIGGMEIIELIKDFDQVIILDSIKTKGGSAGSVYHFTPDDFKETLHLSSFHDLSFTSALKLAEKLDYTLPDKIDIIAIEIVEDLEFSDEFSPPIQIKFEKIFKEIFMLVSRLLE
jgi:hydrogenase maturation protease